MGSIRFVTGCDAEGQRSGFTLIVIAIIGVLTGFLLPALSKARSVAYQATCAVNLKQWAVYVNLYADNFHGALFPHHPSHPMVLGVDGSYKFSEYLVPHYNIPRGVWFCPADTVWKRGNARSPDYYWDPAFHSYGRCSAYCFFMGDNTNRSARFLLGDRDVGRLQDATSDEVLMADVYRVSPAQGYWVLNHRSRLPEGSNVMKADGSVEWRPFPSLNPRYLWGDSYLYYW